MADSLKNKTVKGVLWSGIERFSVQGVTFVVTLIIARILSPQDYGLVGMLAVFIGVASSLVESGFSQALIRKQDRTETDNSTVFYFNIVISFAFYVILFTIAPWVADFYHEHRLKELLRVLGIVVVINSFGVVQQALYTSKINFKVQAKATFLATLLSGIAGVSMAFMGCGVWTLVFQQLLSAFLNTLMLWVYSDWRPQLIYSWKSFRELFSFGSKLLLSGLIDTTYNNLYQLVIGKIFSAYSLGYFSKAKDFAKFPSVNINSIVGRVTYPILCSIKDDDERLERDYRMILRISAFIVFPLMCGLAALSHPLVKVLLGTKWEFAATLLTPLCFSMMWFPTHAINLNLLKVKGRSDLFLRLEIIKKIVGVGVLVASIPFGLTFMCYCHILSSLIALFINTYYTGKLINVGFIQQMKDLLPTLFLSLAMSLIISVVIGMIEFNVIRLITGIFVGVIFYITFAKILRFKELSFIFSIIKRN